MNLVFATHNDKKAEEIEKMLPFEFSIKTLKDIRCANEIPETGDTLEENASLKTKYVEDNFELNCFADDTGLEIEALDGEPGVYSARYAGKDKDAEANMAKVLEKMEGVENRKARFRTVISLRLTGVEHQFEGVVNGTIRKEKSGEKGFGYDPIFEPEGYDITFSEMDTEEKNKISHRGKATEKLIEFLKDYVNSSTKS